MKKLLVGVMLAMVVILSGVARAEVTLMSEWEMKHTLLIGFVAYYEVDSNTPVDPLDEERKIIREKLVARMPGKEVKPAIYTEPVIVQAGTDLANFFEVGSVVINHVASVTNSTGGSTWSGDWGSATNSGPNSYTRTCLPAGPGGFTGLMIQAH